MWTHEKKEKKSYFELATNEWVKKEKWKKKKWNKFSKLKCFSPAHTEYEGGKGKQGCLLAAKFTKIPMEDIYSPVVLLVVLSMASPAE